jgi:hypothetical protein
MDLFEAPKTPTSAQALRAATSGPSGGLQDDNLGGGRGAAASHCLTATDKPTQKNKNRVISEMRRG